MLVCTEPNSAFKLTQNFTRDPSRVTFPPAPLLNVNDSYKFLSGSNQLTTKKFLFGFIHALSEKNFSVKTLESSPFARGTFSRFSSKFSLVSLKITPPSAYFGPIFCEDPFLFSVLSFSFWSVFVSSDCIFVYIVISKKYMLCFIYIPHIEIVLVFRQHRSFIFCESTQCILK